MSKTYSKLGASVIDPDLEAKVKIETTPEPISTPTPTDLYAAITTNILPINLAIPTLIPEVKQYAHTATNRLYASIIPEKPNILAEERIFVYVPKVTRDTAGIAKFLVEQFNVINGVVSIKSNYLFEMLSNALLKPDLIIIVTTLPAQGSPNRIYLRPIDGITSNTFIWNSETASWVELGSTSLNLANYYTKDQVMTLINNITIDLSAYYTKSQITTLLSSLATKTDYYTKVEIDNLLSALNNLVNYYTKDQVDQLLSDLLPIDPNTLHIGETAPTDPTKLYWGKLTDRD